MVDEDDRLLVRSSSGRRTIWDMAVEWEIPVVSNDGIVVDSENVVVVFVIDDDIGAAVTFVVDVEDKSLSPSFVFTSEEKDDESTLPSASNCCCCCSFFSS